MPRKTTAKATGVWEKEPGSNIWWIRYRADGILKREKVGRKGDAIALYQKRKSELRVGIKLPDNMRRSALRFKVICDDALVYSKKHHRNFRTVNYQLQRVTRDFGDMLADSIKPAEIDLWLSKTTKTPATSNRYRALFSLIFREALRNGKVTSNPARLVRQQHENNGRIRFLTDVEEASLRAVIADRFPEHDAELDTTLRCVCSPRKKCPRRSSGKLRWQSKHVPAGRHSFPCRVSPVRVSSLKWKTGWQLLPRLHRKLRLRRRLSLHWTMFGPGSSNACRLSCRQSGPRRPTGRVRCCAERSRSDGAGTVREHRDLTPLP